MARPPRIPYVPNADIGLVYFVTLCVERRLKVLDRPEVFEAVSQTLSKMDRWITHAFVLMPDHVHFLLSPTDREMSVALFSKWFKHYLKSEWNFKIEWQEGCFDHLLRKSESLQDKWIYLRENPVRAGLVPTYKQWPYAKGFDL